MIFRWTFWGDNSKNMKMLFYSISSFKHFFGSENEYIVYTDNLNNISKKVKEIADIRLFPESGLFNIKSTATWLKWCPSPRLDISKTEFYVDSDVFLVKYPKEVDDFINDNKLKFAILDEFKGEYWQHGVMHKKALSGTPYVNAGFFVQKAGSDITEDLISEYRWWKENIKSDEHTHHDEQGALAISLTKYLESKELLILPKEKYALISNDQNVGVENLEKITLFHATWPEHPAFYKFLPELNKIIHGPKK